jgi:hypothetical protein
VADEAKKQDEIFRVKLDLNWSYGSLSSHSPVVRRGEHM